MTVSRTVGALGVSLLALTLAACGDTAGNNTTTNTSATPTSAAGAITGASPTAATSTPANHGNDVSPSPSQHPAGGVTKSVQVVPSDATIGAFQPAGITISVGDSIEWNFTDQSNAHTVTADDGSFDSGTQSAGAKYTRKFTTAGMVRYHCSLHANMVASVTVKA